MTDQPGVFTHRLDDGRVQLVALRLKRPMTLNDSLAAGGFALKANPIVRKEIRNWRRWAGADDVKLRVLSGQLEPITGQYRVDVYQWRKDRRSKPDIDAPTLASKAVVDGLADAHLLPNGDGPDWQVAKTYHPFIPIGDDGLRVVVTTLLPVEQTALDLTLPITERTPAP